MFIDTWKEQSEPLYSKIQPNQFEEDLMEEELKEDIEYVTTDDEMLNSYGGENTKMGSSSMASTHNVFKGLLMNKFRKKLPSWNIIEKDVLCGRNKMLSF